MNSTFYEFINIESNIRNLMDGLPAEVNLYDFIKYIRFSYRFLIWENCCFPMPAICGVVLMSQGRLDRKEAHAGGRQALPAHDGKRQFMAPGGRLMTENDKSWGISADF
jgi:hypothetical protein